MLGRRPMRRTILGLTGAPALASRMSGDPPSVGSSAAGRTPERDGLSAGLLAAFVLDADGNNIEVVCVDREPQPSPRAIGRLGSVIHPLQLPGYSFARTPTISRASTSCAAVTPEPQYAA